MTTLVSLLSIDAWADADGWQWNDWHKIASVPVGTADLSPRKLFRFLRSEGYLSASSVGRVAVEDDQYNIVIIDSSNHRPLYAIAYGEAIN